MAFGQDTLLNRSVAAGSASWDIASDGQSWISGGDATITYGVTLGVGGTIIALANNFYNSSYLGSRPIQDIDLYCQFQMSANTNMFGLVLRAADQAQGNQYALWYYNNQIAIGTLHGGGLGSQSTIQSTSFTAPSALWYGLHAKAIGSNISLTMWDASGSEPSTPTLAISDTTYTASGYYGVFSSTSIGITTTVRNVVANPSFQYTSATWVTRDGPITWLTRDGKNTWKARS